MVRRSCAQANIRIIRDIEPGAVAEVDPAGRLAGGRVLISPSEYQRLTQPAGGACLTGDRLRYVSFATKIDINL